MSEWKSLSSITSKIGSGSTPRGGNSVYSDSGMSFIRSQNVLDMDFSTENLAFINDNQAEKLNNVIVEKNDILLNITGDSIARCTVVPEEILPARVNQHVSIIRCKNTEESKYVMYYLQYMKKYLLQISKVGGTRNALTKEAIGKLPIKISDDCNKISKILDNIDQKIHTNNQINQELEAMAKTLYDYWFVQFDFPDQNGKPYKSSGGKMVYHPELKREIPEGWGVEKLDELGTIVGGSTPTKSISDNFTKGGEGYSWITPNDLSNNKGNKFIKNGEIDVTVRGLKDASLKLYPEGTVLMSSRAPVGYLAIATKELTTNQGFKSFIPDKKYDKNYIYYTLQNCLKVIEQNASGSTFKEISATVLKDITIIQPSLDVVKKFEEKVSSINSYIKVNEEQNQELTQLRDWLLPMLMNGQVKI